MNYYYVPIVLKYLDGILSWIYDYENQIVIHTFNEILAQEEAERMYKVEKENNLEYGAGDIKNYALSDQYKEALTHSYPKEIVILLRSKSNLHNLNEKKGYQEEELNPLFYRPK